MVGKDRQALIIVSGKGGTGKTLLSANVALSLSRKMKVALIDADIKAPNLTYIMNIADRKSEITNKRKIIPIQVNDNLQVFSPETYFNKKTGHKRAILPSDDEIINIIYQSVNDVEWNDPDIFIFDSDPSTNAVLIGLKEIFKGRLSALVITTNDISSAFDCERMVDGLISREIKINGIIGNQIKMGLTDRVDHISKVFGIPIFMEIPYNDKIWEENNKGNPYINGFEFRDEWIR